MSAYKQTMEYVVKCCSKCFFLFSHKNDECVTTIEIDIATLTANLCDIYDVCGKQHN